VLHGTSEVGGPEVSGCERSPEGLKRPLGDVEWGKDRRRASAANEKCAIATLIRVGNVGKSRRGEGADENACFVGKSSPGRSETRGSCISRAVIGE
jgi:hypothetical protein